MKSFEKTVNMLSDLRLKGIQSILNEIISEAEKSKISYIAFLKSLLESEIEFRKNRRIKRIITGVHFPIEKQLEVFDFTRVTGISKSDITNLLEFNWLDNHNNILFFGPAGIGKTHLSIVLGLKAVLSGYTVCFET